MVTGLSANVALGGRHYPSPRGAWAARPKQVVGNPAPQVEEFEVVLEQVVPTLYQAAPLNNQPAWRVVAKAPVAEAVLPAVPAESADLEAYVEFARRLHQLYPQASAAA